MARARINLKTWLGWSIVTFLLLILIHLALPALFLSLKIPSFKLGHQGWILHWQNDVTGSGIHFSLTTLFTAALIIGFFLMLIKAQRRA